MDDATPPGPTIPAGTTQPPTPTVRNLTPHAVHLLGPDTVVELPPAGPPARLVLAPDQPDGEIRVGDLTVPLVRTAATPTVTGLPDPESGVLLIVARPVAEAFPHRDDLAYPHQVVRDEHGVIIGCRALGRPTHPFVS
ncbi:MAG: hypothetical protein HYR62_03230 [Actinobacteria bacterium]|nr:hypothetical protein [Actinomycetota bacterium]MBI3689020.1 hypothetical protein [Actinomycetota bacterium]